MIVQESNAVDVEECSVQATMSLSVTKPDSQRVTASQPDSSDENELSSSTQSTSESENVEDGSEVSISNGASSTSSSYSFGSSIEGDLLTIFGPESSHAPNSSSLKTYKLIGDNIDKKVKPSDFRIDSQAESLHYFQTYAVRDRIDLTAFDDTPPVLAESEIDTTTLLPSDSDYEELMKNFSILVARVLKQYMPFMEKYGSGLERHIRHKFSEEMGLKSEVVSLYC